MGFGKSSNKPVFPLAFLPFFMIAVIVCGMSACGIDDEPYLSPVDPSGVVLSMNTNAQIDGISTIGETEYAPSYLLYYKIYISDRSESSAISSDMMSGINTTLSSDYNGILPYTTLNTSSIQVFTPTVFSNRNFYPMRVNSTETLVSSTSRITIAFTSTPSLTLNNGTAQTLYRSNDGGSFTPLPEDDLRFRNFSELRNTQNRDVAQGSGGIYSYCAVYIIKRGVNPNTLTAIYSAPTFIAVFRLPNEY
jgi:hypothetical protein